MYIMWRKLILNEGYKMHKNWKLLWINYGNCISCKYGYYLNKKENKCIKKDERFENCKLNIDGEICETCNLDYYFDNDNIWHIVIIAQKQKIKNVKNVKIGIF